MKDHIDTLDATPSKRIFHSIIADYDLKKAICELVDNALDTWIRDGQSSPIRIDIDLDKEQQRIRVTDNAGGIAKEDLSYIVGPGHTGTEDTDHTIGIFGVGTKRAVVALAQDITVSTRKESDTYQVEFDDAWIDLADDWSLPVFKVGNISKGTTVIELIKLRNPILEDTDEQLKTHLSATYAKFLQAGKIELLVNDSAVSPQDFENWAFPPGYEPRRYSGAIHIDESVVSIDAIAGLSKVSSPATGEYGVYFYCNERLIARALKTFEVGFTTGLAGVPHADISLARVIISIKGEARYMPWNSTKSEIIPTHRVFIALQSWLLKVVKDYTSLSRRMSKFEGGWPENVFKYSTGKTENVTISDFPSVKSSYLPPLPSFKPRFSQEVKSANASLAKKKPWITGLYESLISVDWVLKQKLEQRNRIALLLLDSTLEIAFKEFLVNESGKFYPDQQLPKLFAKRHLVHQEVEANSSISQAMWKKIKFFYQMRCQLIHQRATVAISDTQIDVFREVAQYVMKKLFAVKFPK